mgnify:CR=1 FL=1
MNPYDNESIPDSSTKPCLLQPIHAISTFLPGLFPAQAHSGLQHPECTVRGTDIQLFSPLKASSISMAPFIVVIILSMP